MRVLVLFLLIIQMASAAEFTKASALAEVQTMSELLSKDDTVGAFLKTYISPDDMEKVIRDQNSIGEMEKSFAASEKRTALLEILKGLTAENLSVHEDEQTMSYVPAEGARPLVLQFKNEHWYLRN
jgi:hypothetical protein